MTCRKCNLPNKTHFYSVSDRNIVARGACRPPELIANYRNDADSILRSRKLSYLTKFDSTANMATVSRRKCDVMLIIPVSLFLQFFFLDAKRRESGRVIFIQIKKKHIRCTRNCYRNSKIMNANYRAWWINENTISKYHYNKMREKIL